MRSIAQFFISRVSFGKFSSFCWGTFASLAWAPYDMVWPFFLSFLFLCHCMVHTETSRHALRCGWWWGFGFYGASLWWIGNSLWVDAKQFAWLWPISVVFFPALLGCVPACIMWYTVKNRRLFQSKSVVHVILRGCTLWVFAENTLMNMVFPWLSPAYIWNGLLPAAQMVLVCGISGVVFLTMIFAGSLYIFCVEKRSAIRLCCGTFWTILVYVTWYSGMEWAKQPTKFFNNPSVRIVQPCIPQEQKGKRAYAYEHLETMLSLSCRPTETKPAYVIWHEGAYPFCLTPTTQRIDVEDSTFSLIFGAAYKTNDEKLFNALMVQPTVGALQHLSDKHTLLPFGEYVPFRSFLNYFIPARFLQKITVGKQDFSPGKKPGIHQLQNLPPFVPLICYESVFAPLFVPSEASWILVCTNDAWFGHSPGPYQHAVVARFKAMDTGLPLIRCANSGISMVVDGYGRIIHKLPLSEQGIIDTKIPRRLHTNICYQRDTLKVIFLFIHAIMCGFYFLRFRYFIISFVGLLLCICFPALSRILVWPLIESIRPIWHLINQIVL